MLKRRIGGEIKKILNQVEVALDSITGKKISSTPNTDNLQELGSKVGGLKGKTVIMSGGSRGIGLAIAERFAKDGANVAILAKTTEPHPKLPGTIYTAAEAIDQAGGKGLPIVVDVRDERNVEDAVKQVVDTFGGIDIVVNNASAIHLANVENTPAKKFDLMFNINVRGTFLLVQKCLPHLMKAQNPHILTLAPPINLDNYWFKSHGTYTTSKYAMSLMAKSFAEENRSFGIASNNLWPKTTIATAAITNMAGGKLLEKMSRRPEIMADAAYEIVTRNAKDVSGFCFIDDEVLASTGTKDFEHYSVEPGSKLQPDLFLST